MKYGKIEGLDKKISRLVQGTVMIRTDKLEESFALLDGVFAQGGNTFDTAHGYGNGECERTLGMWVAERGLRDEVVIITKGAHHNRDRERVTPFDISADLHDSLARLKMDNVDIYLLHRDNEAVPVGPIVEILNEYYAAGKYKIFGGSNWSHRRIEEANEYAYKHNLVPFTISSPNFSLAEQIQPPWPNCISISGNKGAEAQAWYIEHKMPLFTWSSLAGGFFSGRLNRHNLDSFEANLDKLCVDTYATDENFKRLDRVSQLAEEKDLSIPQIATAYIMNHELDIYALVGCRTPDEFKANAQAVEVELTPAEMAWLELKNDTR